MANDKNFKAKNGLTLGDYAPTTVEANYRISSANGEFVQGGLYNYNLGSIISSNVLDQDYSWVNADDSTVLPVDGGTSLSLAGSFQARTFSVSTSSGTAYTNYAPICTGSYFYMTVEPSGGVSSQRVGARGILNNVTVYPTAVGNFLGTGQGFVIGATNNAGLGYTCNGVNFVQVSGSDSVARLDSGNTTLGAGKLSTVTSRFAGYLDATDTLTIGTMANFAANASSVGSQYGANITLDRYAGLYVPYPTVYSTNLTITDDIYGIYVTGSGFTNRFGGDTQLFPDITTTASAANVYMDTGASNRLYVSTSSIEYKTDVENLGPTYADNILNLRPVWYRSTASADPADWSYYGLIAEEVAAVEPRLVHYGYKQSDYEEVIVTEEVRVAEDSPEYDEANPDKTETVEKTERRLKDGAVKAPNGVAYERLSVLLLDIVKRQGQQIEALEARVAALEA